MRPISNEAIHPFHLPLMLEVDHLYWPLVLEATMDWNMLNYFRSQSYRLFDEGGWYVTIANDNSRGNIFWFSQSVAARGETLSLILLLFVAFITQISTLWLFIVSNEEERTEILESW